MSLTIDSHEALIQAAIKAKSYAYAPYTKFRVGAALLCTDGTVIMGCNVENAAYGASICAERAAMVKAISEGKKEFDAIAITTDVPSAVSPCGICRQVLREFCRLDMPVLLVPGDYPQRQGRARMGTGAGTGAGGGEEAGGGGKGGGEREREKGDGGVRVEMLGGLLPSSFGPEELERERIPVDAGAY